MPKRPRSHLIEDQSRQRLRDLFGQLGWVMRDLYPDYGEDFLVRVFNNGIATHYSFFIQAKGTDHIEKCIRKNKEYLTYPVDIEHLEHWENFWEPVVLTVWDSKSDTTYWEIIQDCFQSKTPGYVGNLSVRSISSRAATYASGDLRKREQSRRIVWR
jgi:hypothetical protein